MITDQQAAVLRYLRENGDASINALYQFICKQRIGPVMVSLAESRLIRIPAADVKITPAGLSALAEWEEGR